MKAEVNEYISSVSSTDPDKVEKESKKVKVSSEES